MRPEALQQAEEWLVRAERDLRAADTVLASVPPLLEIAAYHAQQAGEKALKAFLTAHDRVFRLTHDLTELQQQCEAIDSAFAPFANAAQTLTPYAIQFRYPGGALEPAADDAQQAVELARSIFDFVRQQVSPLPQ